MYLNGWCFTSTRCLCVENRIPSPASSSNATFKHMSIAEREALPTHDIWLLQLEWAQESLGIFSQIQRAWGGPVTLTSGILATVIEHEFRGSLAAQETHWRPFESTYLCPSPTPDQWIRILTWWESRTQKINKSGLLHAAVTIMCNEMKTTILKIVCSRDQHKEIQEMKQSAHRY